MEARCPALALPYLRARLFQRLALEVVPLEQPSLFLRQLLDRRPHPLPGLLQLDPLIGRERLVGHLHPLCSLQAGGEHHRQSGDSIRDVSYIIVDSASAVASPRIAIGQIAQVGRRALRLVGAAGVSAL